MSKSSKKQASKVTLHLRGSPNPKQKLFFKSTAKYTAYGGARGGGKSWALRRKLILLALRYPGLKALIIRRTYPELLNNHTLPLRSELGEFAPYADSRKRFEFPNGSSIMLGYCSCDGDVLRYQGQEYDIIAIDEATQLSEYQFNALKGSLRGSNDFPKRMYLTCNPGGIGHAWVKRLFIDRDFRDGENPDDYAFIGAKVYDNDKLNADYIDSLRSLPDALRMAWLEGSWELFEGQFFPEFSPERHVGDCGMPRGHGVRYFMGIDYGFDMLAALWLWCDADGKVGVYRELCLPDLTISEAAERIAELCRYDKGIRIEYAAASPDLWNRRQDSGMSGVDVMSDVYGMPPLIKADNRRIPGWRCVREYLRGGNITISPDCRELVRCLPALIHDKRNFEDASSEPHSVTHAPEALRYALMSAVNLSAVGEEADRNFSVVRDGVGLAEY